MWPSIAGTATLVLCNPSEVTVTTLRWKNTFDHTHFECLYFYLCLRYSNSHRSTLCTTVAKYILQHYRSDFKQYDLVLALLVKKINFTFGIQILNAMANFSFLFLSRWPLKPSQRFSVFDIFHYFWNIALFYKNPILGKECHFLYYIRLWCKFNIATPSDGFEVNNMYICTNKRPMFMHIIPMN